MEAIGLISLQDRGLAYFGEVIQDSLLDALGSSVVSSASATLALLAAGTERLFDDVDRYADRVVLRNTSASNSPSLIDRFGVVSINSHGYPLLPKDEAVQSHGLGGSRRCSLSERTSWR